MDNKQLFEEAKNSIINLNKNKALDVARRAITEGMHPIELMNNGFNPGISTMGDLFGSGRMFLPELVQAADIMKTVNEILQDAFPEDKEKKKGTIVIGTVEGDIHDIGKGIVVALMKAHGFTVYDLGRDVKTETFIQKAIEVNADIIGTSALLTTTMIGQKKLEEEMKKSNLRDRFKTIVGGAPVTQRWANKIGANAYAEDAQDGVKKVKELLGL